MSKKATEHPDLAGLAKRERERITRFRAMDAHELHMALLLAEWKLEAYEKAVATALRKIRQSQSASGAALGIASRAIDGLEKALAKANGRQAQLSALPGARKISAINRRENADRAIAKLHRAIDALFIAGDRPALFWQRGQIANELERTNSCHGYARSRVLREISGRRKRLGRVSKM